ncbi:Fucose 4-O-acetylase and related acetyltransferases [Proteus vulgaris]|uniref:Fucose 4-O-acetylase and related acetyltransferases n=1 Tax=Proteus vulgaris TaxID=585 RepID=A0A379F435_PROVU|nr:acyltransferase family protein [Proteus vulgaris]SUC14385.1 Fucose 4-O-acetylase and related acetyltransferases [Proteus vulgaris]
MRVLKIDSIKGVLIFLVVFGHFLESMIGWNGDYSSTLLHLIYSFHMPFFILISGYFFSVNNFNKKLLGIFLVYIIYQTIYSIPSIINGTLSYKYFYEPNWIMWFLMSMLFWVVITKIIKSITLPVIAVSIICSLLVSMCHIDGHILSYMRTIVFYPFFIIGLYLKQRNIGVDRVSRLRVIPLILIFILFTSIFLYFDVDKWVLFGLYSYNDAGYTDTEGVLLRLFVFAYSALIIILLSRIIKENSILSRVGERSLSIYLTHGIIVIILNKFIHLNDSVISVILVLLISIAVTSSLSLNIIEKCNRYIYSLGFIKK